jgi:hypothetical protein
MSRSTETTSKGSSHLIDAKTDLPRCIKLHIQLHLNTSYGCSSCSHACENGKKKKIHEREEWGTSDLEDTRRKRKIKNNDQNVNKKQGKKHTRENIDQSTKHDVESNSNTDTQQKIDEPLGLVEYF